MLHERERAGGSGPADPVRDQAMTDVVVARVRAVPDALVETVERLLDRTVASAVADPLDVPDPGAAFERVRESWSAGPTNPLGIVAGWLASRWATRTLRLGNRLSVPVAAVLTAVPPLAQSFRRGVLELHVLASFVVTRLGAEGIAIDPRLVQRLTVNTYCWPALGADAVRERPSAIVRLATVWVTRTIVPDDPGVRVRSAARSLAGVDLRALSDRFER